MKDTTKARIDRMVAAANSTRFSNDALRELFLSELTQQDRDTSFACSDAVNAITGSVVVIPEGRSSPYVHQITAGSVCRNTSAI